MKKLKIFPKMFLQIFAVLGLISLLVHGAVFVVFPQTYLETRKAEIYHKANDIARNMQGKDLTYIEQALDFYSKSGETKAFVKGRNTANEIQIKNNPQVDLNSNNNSLIIEEREITINTQQKVFLQFVSTADMHKDAKNLSFKFLPYSLLLSLLVSVVVSLIYAQVIKINFHEFKKVPDRMMTLDTQARLNITSDDEIGQLKAQINDLYTTLLRSIDDLERKNQAILRLEKLKYDFLKGASHELKTPLASLKIILENMKYRVGKYKNRDLYIGDCIEIVDGLNQNISQILSVSSLDNLKNDEELVLISDVLTEVIKKYQVLIAQKQLVVNNSVTDEQILIGKTALKIILSNLISNAVKYSDQRGTINLTIKQGWLCIENTCADPLSVDLKRLCQLKFDLQRENSSGLGLYIVSNLLNNYRIKYQASHRQNRFIFKIKLPKP